MKFLGAALLAALALLGAAARAEEGPVLTGTLKTLADRGTILIGVRDSAAPFAFRNPGGQPVGFSVDLCHGIAEDAARALNRDLVEADAPAWQTGLRIVHVTITPEARLPAVMSGAIDLECGSTTANEERAKSVAFSPVFFLAGTKILVPITTDGRSLYAAWPDLAGHSVAVGTGTTTIAVVRQLAHGMAPPVRIEEVSGLDAAYGLLSAGTADALASDDILLAGFVATKPDGARFRVVGDYLSFEPYALMLRRDDPAFADLVQASFSRMAAEGRLTALYNRWLRDRLPTGERLNLPMSPQLLEMYRALGQPE